MQRLLVPIASVRVNHKKLRKLHPKKVAQYERDYECGDEFPPIQVENCGAFYTIRDGRHRYIAQYNLGYQMIEVVVVRGGGAAVARDVQDVRFSANAATAFYYGKICLRQNGAAIGN